MIKLLKFRVTNFRSVKDSGWIEIDRVAALIGTNESGKTNLLTPLWKLKPAQGGEINPMADYPRAQYADFRDMPVKPDFIQAHFELDTSLIDKLADITGTTPQDVQIAEVSRKLDGKYAVNFPNAIAIRDIPKDRVIGLLSNARDEIDALNAGKTEEALKASMLVEIDAMMNESNVAREKVDAGLLKKMGGRLATINIDSANKRSTIGPRFGQLADSVSEMVESTSKPLPASNADATRLVIERIPSFVYYSNYGNLDSEIYLPHVIDNMLRTDLGSREEAKARTLKILFSFVKLEPQEIWELGRDAPIVKIRTVNHINAIVSEVDGPEPTEEEIREVANKKKEREILLTSASASLTKKFLDWWRQGEYRFRFDADGDHFRIWVSDDKRPEEIELEGRSTGLQWFLSFYLTFLVESSAGHQDSILLLDEPGQSLHPLAQHDLSKFFDNLATTNQLVYTAHSPFLVDPDHLDRVKVVYIDSAGATVVSSDLRASEGNKAQSRSVYPVNAALGLSVSDTMLEGCQPIIVEGQSDQIYLASIKNYLLRHGELTPQRELIFLPSGGVKGVAAIMPILAGKTEALPFLLLDGDTAGQAMANALKSNVYQGQHDRVLLVSEIIGLEGAEIEDLLPKALLASIVDKYLRGMQEEDFSDVVVNESAVVPQIKAFANKYGINLEKGWKVEIAKRVKMKLLSGIDSLVADASAIDIWKRLFDRMKSNGD